MNTSRTDVRRSRVGRKFWILFCSLALLFAFFIILTPTFHDKYFGVAKNESATVGSLRKIYELENAYAAAYPGNGFVCQLKQLRPTDNLPNVYGDSMNLLTGEWVGYKFEIVGCTKEENGVFAHYQVTAVPLKRWSSGVRAFCTDQSGDIFYDQTGSASECLAARQRLP